MHYLFLLEISGSNKIESGTLLFVGLIDRRGVRESAELVIKKILFEK
jgi:hypothetical protein